MLTRGKVISLAVPIILAQAATATTGVVDTAIMGRFGDKADLAAVAIAAVAYSFIYWGFGFLRMSTTGLTAQANGQHDTAESRAILLRALMLGGAIGVALFLLSPLLKIGTFAAFEGTQTVESLAKGYFNARIWGAPAYLMGLAVTGWMLGTGKTGQMLAFQIVMNGTNAGLDAWFVAGLDWGPTGIGAGTAIAEWVALIFGLILVAPAFRGHARLLDRDKLTAPFAANRDIMIRTLALVFCFAWFVRSGTLISTAVTAGNEVLLLYLFGGGWVIETFIRDPEARAATLAYLPWCAAVPLLGIAAWQLDGLFLGTTQGRALRNAGVISAVLYLGADMLLRPAWGNTGVWAAFLTMYVFRAAALGAYVPRLFRDLSRPHQPAS